MASSTPALERARARALGENLTVPSEQGTPARPGAASPQRRQGAAAAEAGPRLSGQIIQRPDGSRVPIEYFDLTQEQQANFDALVKEAEAEAEGESRFDQTALGLVDQQLSQSKRIKSLESQLGIAAAAMEAMQRRIDGIDTAVELGKSEALSEQQMGIAQMTTNLSAIRAEAASEMAEYNRQREVGAAEARDQLEAQATAIEALRGSVKSTTELMTERSNAVVSALADAESRQQQLGVAVVELENRTDAIGNPITRAEVKNIITTEVTAEVKAQAPDLIDQQIQDDKELGVINPGGQTMDREYQQRKRADAEAFRANATRGR